MTDGDGSRAAIRVEIGGEEYTLRTNADEAYTRRCAALVDERIEEIRQSTGLDPHKAAILAALSLSDDVLQQRADSESLKRDLGAQIASAAERLKGALEAR